MEEDNQRRAAIELYRAAEQYNQDNVHVFRYALFLVKTNNRTLAEVNAWIVDRLDENFQRSNILNGFVAEWIASGSDLPFGEWREENGKSVEKVLAERRGSDPSARTSSQGDVGSGGDGSDRTSRV